MEKYEECELSSVLYYADFLSLKDKSIPVTDNCKYYYIEFTINGDDVACPVNSSFILNLEPNYDKENKYFIHAKQEYELLCNKFDKRLALSFMNNICNLKACGTVNAPLMLRCIHRYSSPIDRKQAMRIYENYRNNQKYKHQITNDNGDIEERLCTRYVYNAEKNNKIYEISEGTLVYTNPAKKNIKNDK